MSEEGKSIDKPEEKRQITVLNVKISDKYNLYVRVDIENGLFRISGWKDKQMRTEDLVLLSDTPVATLTDIIRQKESGIILPGGKL